MIEEEWRDIEGYEGIYKISNTGKVKSLTHRKMGGLLKVNLDKDGYEKVVVRTQNGKHKNYSIHRLVALAFIQNPCNLPQVNHIDANKQNNNVSNLEWCDSFRNMRHIWDFHPEWIGKWRGENGRRAKLKENEVLKIYDLAWGSEKLIKDIAIEYDVTHSLISLIKYGYIWDYLTLHSTSNNPHKYTPSLSRNDVILIHKLVVEEKQNCTEVAKILNIKRNAVYSIKYKQSYKSIIDEIEQENLIKKINGSGIKNYQKTIIDFIKPIDPVDPPSSK